MNSLFKLEKRMGEWPPQKKGIATNLSLDFIMWYARGMLVLVIPCFLILSHANNIAEASILLCIIYNACFDCSDWVLETDILISPSVPGFLV